MRLLDAAFDVLSRAGEPLLPSEIVRSHQIGAYSDRF